jgi:cysteine-rich repeat protein
VSEFTPPAGLDSSFRQADVVPFNNWPSRYFQDGQNTIVIAVKNIAGNAVNPEGLLVSVPNAFSTASTCRRTAAVCGDGRREGEEACDDGNMAPGDGCAADCTVEDGYVCKGAPSTCENCEMAGGMPDADGDGERDACDLCPNDANRGTFNWVTWDGMPRDNGRDDPARRWQWSGTVGNTPVNYYSNQSWRPQARALENQALFPARFQVPTDNRAHVENFLASANLLEFGREVSNPLLVFASIGAPRVPVDIQFNQPIEVVWTAPTVAGMTTAATVSEDGRTLSGESTWAIVRVPGNHRAIGFNYLVTENSADFMFGFGGSNDDANSNGTPDVCE